MFFATTQQTTEQAGGFAGFFAQYGLMLMLLVLIVFMFWSSRRRQKKVKAEQESKARQLLPGVKVLLQGGLYGTLVEYDAEDLSKSARVELAPGVEIEVHSQSILRVVEPEDTTVPMDDAPAIDDAIADEPAAAADTTTPDADDKPQA
ncbi:preprotein translocase subunit YajC [Microbacterium invictum]|uniref:Preprotein translocase subunit YajC n=1 Tax=Microbacterium invictum TaxID=515415 RepID=A0AA40SMV8_9MICO|nr:MULTISPECIES: preprotein translocase subunit YajC [Microbacterium]MBB4139160.1 preprotein translocase subunit YajC [Microbacterium invictum]